LIYQTFNQSKTAMQLKEEIQHSTFNVQHRTKAVRDSSAQGVFTSCRLEIGDTAGWKPALPLVIPA
jgi:hypothetical protein